MNVNIIKIPLEEKTEDINNYETQIINLSDSNSNILISYPFKKKNYKYNY